MRHGSLFSGIGGFDLAAHWMGWENVFHCEWNEFGQKVLKHHFPEADSYRDICKTDFRKYAGTVEIISGGFPCQPFSLAGKRKGTEDERYLWHEMLRAVQEIKPQFVIAENVYGIVNIDGGMVFEQVCLDLETEGYEVQPFIIPACAKDAPHRRDRVWVVAHSDSRGFSQQGLCLQQSRGTKAFSSSEDVANTKAVHVQRQPNRQEQGQSWGKGGWSSQQRVGDSPNGLPPGMVGWGPGWEDGIPRVTIGEKDRVNKLKALGNSIVPQVAAEIMMSIKD